MPRLPPYSLDNEGKTFTLDDSNKIVKMLKDVTVSKDYRTIGAIARTLRRSEFAVRYFMANVLRDRLEDEGCMPKAPFAPWTPAEENFLNEAWSEGYNYPAIGRILLRKPQAVEAHRRQMLCQKAIEQGHEPDWDSRLLSKAQHKDLVRWRDPNHEGAVLDWEEIARRFGLTKTQVRRYYHGHIDKRQRESASAGPSTRQVSGSAYDNPMCLGSTPSTPPLASAETLPLTTGSIYSQYYPQAPPNTGGQQDMRPRTVENTVPSNYAGLFAEPEQEAEFYDGLYNGLYRELYSGTPPSRGQSLHQDAQRGSSNYEARQGSGSSVTFLGGRTRSPPPTAGSYSQGGTITVVPGPLPQAQGSQRRREGRRDVACAHHPYDSDRARDLRRRRDEEVRNSSRR